MNTCVPSPFANTVDKEKRGMEPIQISFIVPIYNVEEYVRECVLSILVLEGIPFEIILVDDGSLDNSMGKITDLIDGNPLITTVRQRNKGQAAARNRGLDLAKGMYIFFVDSDDKIDASTLRDIFSQKEGNEDIIIGDFYKWDGNNSLKEPSLVNQPLRTTGEVVLQRFFPTRIGSVVWRNIYKRSFLQKHRLSFLEGAYYEDVDWTPRCLALAGEILYINQAIYYYRNQRMGSTTNSPFSLKKYHDLFKVSQAMEEFASSIDEKRTATIISLGASNLLLSALRHARSSNLTVDYTSLLDFYKKLRLPICNNEIMRYILFFSTALFFRVLKHRKL